jgi:general secretion pathway protein J
MNPLSRVRGFTLLEMLIGMTLLGFILSLLFAGLNLGMRSWEAGEQRMVTSSQQAVIIDFIRRTLEQTYPLYWRLDNEERLAFVGETGSLRIVAPVPMPGGGSSNYLVAIDLIEGEKGRDLAMRWHVPDPRAPGFGPAEEAKPKVLAKAVREVAFAYFGAENDIDEPAWHDQWLDQKTPPELIRLKLTMENGETWPDIVAATPIRVE